MIHLHGSALLGRGEENSFTLARYEMNRFTVKTIFAELKA